MRLAAPFAQRHAVAKLAGELPLFFRCTDANTVLCVASIADELETPLGLWLNVDENYQPQLAARDIGTLATITPLSNVVIEVHANASDHADIVAALLTNDEVNYSNRVATLKGAYNRPAPKAPITIWHSVRGKSIANATTLLTPRRVEDGDVGNFLYYE